MHHETTRRSMAVPLRCQAQERLSQAAQVEKDGNEWNSYEWWVQPTRNSYVNNFNVYMLYIYIHYIYIYIYIYIFTYWFKINTRDSYVTKEMCWAMPRDIQDLREELANLRSEFETLQQREVWRGRQRDPSGEKVVSLTGFQGFYPLVMSK